ncbi:hypothetical protein AT267_00860 [Bacillus cereus]|nr:hypothetical protein AT267_00860 [Bacillus cereus]
MNVTKDDFVTLDIRKNVWNMRNGKRGGGWFFEQGSSGAREIRVSKITFGFTLGKLNCKTKKTTSSRRSPYKFISI